MSIDNYGITTMICEDCGWVLNREDVISRISAVDIKPTNECVEEKFDRMREAHRFFHPECKPEYERGMVEALDGE